MTPRSILFVAALAGAMAMVTIHAQTPQTSQPQRTPQPQEPPPKGPTFKVRAEFVRVDALVTNHGTSVAGLKGDDFELRDNGVPQKVSVMEASSLPVDVAMALDVSGSVQGQPLANLKDAATGLVDALRPGDRVALLSFNDLLWIHSPLTNDFGRMRQLIGEMDANGRTSLRDAAQAALLQGDPDAGRALIMLFTDGDDVSSWLADAAIVDTAKRVNAVVYSITIDPPNAKPLWTVSRGDLLDALPSLTGGRRYDAGRPQRLREVFATILQEFRQRYILSYTPVGVDRAGYHALDVRLVKGHKGEVRARPGYFRTR
jgi:Ca-activated chloride channel family protein